MWERGSFALKVLLPPLLWVALWGTLNAGGFPLWLLYPSDIAPIDGLHALRALLPLLVLMGWAIHVTGRAPLRARKPSGAESLWISYGLVGLVASLTGPAPLQGTYWGLVFLVPFAATEVYLWNGDRLARAGRLNHLSWVFGALSLCVMLIAAGEQLLVGSGLGVTAYNVVIRVGEVMGMPMARSSGLSRLAAVVGAVSFVAAWFDGGWRRVGWTAVVMASVVAIYLLGSEGSMIAFSGAIVAVLVLLLPAGGMVILALAVLLAYLAIPESALRPVTSMIPDLASLTSLQSSAWSGRPSNWAAAWESIRAAPILGSGFQADRYLTRMNAQNGFLYATLTGGAVGGLCYVGGLVLLWKRIWQCYRGRSELPVRYRKLFVQVVGVAALLTLRHVPENTSALFSVDLLLMVPVLAYVGELHRSLGGASAG